MENILLFNKPATVFEEAIPMGNGHMGAMVYGGVDIEKISLNEDTLWSGKKSDNPVPDGAKDAFYKGRNFALDGFYKEAEAITEAGMNGKNTQVYMPLGNVVIETGHDDFNNYKRVLDMSSSVASVEYECCGVIFKREYFASFNTRSFAFKISSDVKEHINIKMSFETNHKLDLYKFNDNKLVYGGNCPVDGHSKHGYIYSDEDTGLAFSGIIKIHNEGGTVEFSEGKINIKNADSVVVYISAETNYDEKNPYDKCACNLNSCDDYYMVKNGAISDYKKLYDRVCFSITDKENDKPLYERLKSYDGTDLGLHELIFNFGRYLMIASSREGTQATNLQGIWNEKWLPIWSSNYTLNINTQMNYWPALSCNLTECFEPFIDLVKKLSVTGKNIARDFYGARGFVCHHNTDLWGHANPVGIGVGGTSNYTCWNMASGWLACQLYDYYEYTEDTEILNDVILPVMEDSALFYLDVLTYDKDGRCILTPTTSPENFFVKNGEYCAISKSATMTESILKELFTKIIRANEILGIESDICKDIKLVLDKIPPFKIGDNGTLLEWDEDHEEKDSQHRHVSHLYSLCPGDLISIKKTPELADACKKTLERRGDIGTGWSLGWKINLWARLCDGNRALRLLDKQLTLVEPEAEFSFKNGGTYPNLFDAHPPFQIDGNFGVTAGIAEMLVQCREGVIEILPALPDRWKNGYVKGIKVKGDIEVDITWKDGVVKETVLLSPKDKTVKVDMCKHIKTVELKAKKPYKLK